MTEHVQIAQLDKHDRVILRILQENSNTSLKEIAEKTGLSSSTIHYRINRLIKEKIIVSFTAQVDPIKVGKDILAVSLVNGKYGADVSRKLGDKLAKIPGVWAVYYLLGNIDFAVLLRASTREDLKNIIDGIMKIDEVEKSNTYLVLERIKEDPRVEF
ncbi:MAG TPA: Lrp/AsnC family transcriptional regulator [Thermoplasmata archaeon]|nr:Lrp/AsnC family transcriptional regulator [Thermoplasmata archaeon]